MPNILRNTLDNQDVPKDIFGRIPDKWLYNPPIIHRNSKGKKGLTPFEFVIAIVILDMARNQYAREGVLKKADVLTRRRGDEQRQAVEDFKAGKVKTIEAMYPSDAYNDEYLGHGNAPSIGERTKRAMSYEKHQVTKKLFRKGIKNNVTFHVTKGNILLTVPITNNVRNRLKLLNAIDRLTYKINNDPPIIVDIDEDQSKRLIITINRHWIDGNEMPYTGCFWPLPYAHSSKVLSLALFIESINGKEGWTDLKVLYKEMDIDISRSPKKQLEQTLEAFNKFMLKWGNHFRYELQFRDDKVHVVNRFIKSDPDEVITPATPETPKITPPKPAFTLDPEFFSRCAAAEAAADEEDRIAKEKADERKRYFGDLKL